MEAGTIKNRGTFKYLCMHGRDASMQAFARTMSEQFSHTGADTTGR